MKSIFHIRSVIFHETNFRETPDSKKESVPRPCDCPAKGISHYAHSKSIDRSQFTVIQFVSSIETKKKNTVPIFSMAFVCDWLRFKNPEYGPDVHFESGLEWEKKSGFQIQILLTETNAILKLSRDLKAEVILRWHRAILSPDTGNVFSFSQSFVKLCCYIF